MKIIISTIAISVIVLAVLGGAGFWFVQNLGSNEGEDIAEIAEQIEEREQSTEATKTTKAKESGEKLEVDLEEQRVQTYLHRMTHQKITANKKDGAVEMSSENITNMLKIIKENYESYEHSEFYERTLVAWEKGDFSNVVTVHNTIWNWHGGTVGRATGMMTAEQEADFVEKNFR